MSKSTGPPWSNPHCHPESAIRCPQLIPGSRSTTMRYPQTTACHESPPLPSNIRLPPSHAPFPTTSTPTPSRSQVHFYRLQRCPHTCTAYSSKLTVFELSFVTDILPRSPNAKPSACPLFVPPFKWLPNASKALSTVRKERLFRNSCKNDPQSHAISQDVQDENGLRPARASLGTTVWDCVGGGDVITLIASETVFSSSSTSSDFSPKPYLMDQHRKRMRTCGGR